MIVFPSFVTLKKRDKEKMSLAVRKYIEKDFMRNSLKLFVFKTNLKLRRLISDGITL